MANRGEEIRDVTSVEGQGDPNCQGQRTESLD